MSVQEALVIRNGTVIDPVRNFHGCADVWIRNGEIVAAQPEIQPGDTPCIDATGCYVTPGLIDYHTHLFYGGTHIGLNPDLALLPQGVTTAVDQGSCGFANFPDFFERVISRSQTRIYCNLHIAPAGLTSLPEQTESVAIDSLDFTRTQDLLRRYAGKVLGLKVRQSAEIVGSLMLEPLKAALQMAEGQGCRVAVHTTNPPAAVGELADLLRSGDVYTHMYQGKGNTIIDNCNQVDQSILRARERGVIFDTADGRAHYAFKVVKAALAEGFAPDVISTDLVSTNAYDPAVFGLPLIMSKYLALGLSLDMVIKACTETPAKLIGMAGKLGTLSPGAYADVAVFRPVEKPFTFTDHFGDSLVCRQLLIPQLTISHGKVAYRSLSL